jgi:putative ABC transport system permease protein
MIRTPGTTLAILILLSLGTGGAMAVFNPLYSMLFAPLPFPQPEQLVRIGGDIRMFNNYYSRFEKEEALKRIFSNIAAYLPETTLNIIRIPETGRQKETYPLWVTEEFFATLGVKSIIGFDFSSKEHSNGAVAVVSYRFWRDEMMQTDDAIGRHILFNTAMVRIVGIMPEYFNFPTDTDIWLCRSIGTSWKASPETQFVGRLRPRTSHGQAAKELKNIDFNPATGISGSGGPIVQSLQTSLYGNQYPLLRVLVVVSLLFLSLVCAGVVNLLIVQGIRRKPEITIRLILGATRLNLVSQLLLEMLPLVAVGGLVGWLFSEAMGMWLWTYFPALQGINIDVPVKMAFWAALTLLVTLASGLIPSLYATSLDLNTYLKSASNGKRSFFLSQEFLVGMQLSIALALLIGMGVLLRSMMYRIDFPIGWSLQNIVVVSAHPLDSVGMTFDNVNQVQQRQAMSFQAVQRELKEIPGVMSVGYLTIPFSADAISRSEVPRFTLKILPPKGQGFPDGTPTFVYVQANPHGFDILDIPFVLGRPFNEADVAKQLELTQTSGYGRNGGVAIVNQAAAQRLWPGESAVGKVFYDSTSAYFEVVGVVKNYHQTFGTNDFAPTIYTPMTGTTTRYQLLVKLRHGMSLQNFQENVQQRLSGLTTVATEFEVHPLSEHVKDAMANRRLTLQLLGCFAVLGVIVSGLGAYANASLMAESRKQETGIRIALGAQTWDIIRLALWRGTRAILVGLPFGLLLAWILSKVLSNLLFQVNTNDQPTWVVSCVLLFGVVTIAALVPALRASRVNPINTLHK